MTDIEGLANATGRGQVPSEQVEINRQIIAPYEVRFPTTTNQTSVAAPDVDLRPQIAKYGLDVRTQNGPDCSVYAVTFVLEYLYNARSLISLTALSTDYLNYVTGLMSGVGDFFWRIDDGYQAWGAVLESDFPDQPTPATSVPQPILDRGKRWPRLSSHFIKRWDTSSGASQAQLDEVMRYLDKGTPVCLGMWFPQNTAGYSTTVVDDVPLLDIPPLDAEKNVSVFDGHSVALVGYKRGKQFPGGGYFIFRNSWGATTFGDDGYAYLPFDYLIAFANDLFTYDVSFWLPFAVLLWRLFGK